MSVNGRGFSPALKSTSRALALRQQACVKEQS
jgi:hypothetical protein